MSVNQPGNVAYGFSQSLLDVPNMPIIAQRDPTSNDKAVLGTLWINQQTNGVFIITSIVDNMAHWSLIATSGVITSIVTDSGTATPIGGVIDLFGGANIVTDALGNVIHVAVTPNIDLPPTNAAGTEGVYLIGGVPFGFMFPPSSVYVGNAGNTTNNPLLALHNVGVGESALTAITTGNNNTAVGGGTLGSNTTGLNNVALGYLAMNTNTTGDTNVALGNQAMENILAGNDNLAVGFASGSDWLTTESSNIAIGHVGVVGESHAIHLGTQGGGAGQQNTCFIAGINGVTVGSPAFVTIDTGTFQMGTHPGTLVETIDGDTGSATGDPIKFHATPNSGSSVEFSASGDTVDLFIGDFASGNAIVGNSAGNGTLSGTENTSLGVGTLAALTTGTGNSALGFGSSGGLTTGGNNVSVGTIALVTATTGNDNVAVGSGALNNVTTGSGNIAIGRSAADNYFSTESYNIVIGNAGTTTDTNTIRIGTQGGGAGQQNECFIAGINGVTVGTPVFVTIDTGTGQMGVAASGGVETIDGDATFGSATGNPLTFTGLTHGGSSVWFSGAGTTVTLNIGDQAGLSNCIVGDQAGNAGISGGSNTGLGVENLANLTTGDENVAIGTQALFTLTDGANNVAIGRQCMFSVTHSSQTVAIGGSAAANLTTGNQNIAIGLNAGSFLSTGGDNIIIGPNANMATAAAGNLVIGNNAGTNCITGTESYNIYLSNLGVNGENNTGRIGTTGSGVGEITDCYIAGTVHADTGLDVTAGNLDFPATTSSAAGVITQAGQPFVHSFGDASCVFVGDQAGGAFTNGSIANIGIGYQALYSVTGAGSFSNIGIGYQALYSVAAGSSSNIAIGSQASGGLTTGINNTVVGASSGVAGASGYNALYGFEAGLNLVGGENSNIYIMNAGVASENNTMRLGTTGAGNGQVNATYIAGVAGVTVSNLNTVTIDTVTGQLGSTAGGSGGVTTIDGDTGSATGATITFTAAASGSTTTFNASGSTVTLDLEDGLNNIVIGAGTTTGLQYNVGFGDNVFAAGGATSYQSIGIGFNTLRAAGGTQNVGVGVGALGGTTFAGNYNLALGTTAGIAYDGSEGSNVVIAHIGVLGESNTIRIGTQGAGNLEQNVCFIAGIFGSTVGVSGIPVVVDNAGQLGTVVSSRRYKENIESMEGSSAPVLDLRPVTFTYKNDLTREKKYGLIAEEVEGVMPDLVAYNKAGDPESVKYQDIPILLLNEIQKQHNLIADLMRRIERLERRGSYESKS